MALGKLFRTTVFKISLAYLAISAIGAGLVFSSVGLSMNHLIGDQIAQTIETDLTGLSEQYAQGGIRRLVNVIQRRTRRPGAGLYLVTPYHAAVDPRTARRALARIFVLAGGFHLLVGQDLEEGEKLRQILGRALLVSLIWLVMVGTIGGLWVSQRVLNRVDSINANARAIVAGDLSGRLQVAGTGDELDRLVQNFNAMLDRIYGLMIGLKEVS